MKQPTAILLALAGSTLLAACQGSSFSLSPRIAVTPSPMAVSASPRASPQISPAAGALGGWVIRLVPNGVVIETEGREIEVNLGTVIDVWKETSVPASALEVGDRLFINGTGGSPFVARHVWANIAQIDGVIRAIDHTGMDLEVRPSGQVWRVDLSQFIEFGTADGSRQMTRADLVIGREVGLVVYRPSAGPLRATRVWMW